MTEEIWKKCSLSEKHKVSSFGRIKGPRGIMHPTLGASGKTVQLKGKSFLVHRLVALEFIENSEKLPHVGHKDRKLENNNVDNLFWTNTNKDLCPGRKNVESARKILQYSKEGELLGTFTMKQLLEKIPHLRNPHIRSCCNGKLNSHGGYIWKYLEQEDLPEEIWKDLEYKGHKFKVSSRGRILNGNQNKTYGTLSQGYRKYASTGVHRLVGMAFCEGKTDEKKYINHKDGNKQNNHFENLEWCTQSQNMKHAVDTGLLTKFNRKQL